MPCTVVTQVLITRHVYRCAIACCFFGQQVDGKLHVAAVAGSPTSAAALVRLVVDSEDGLLSSKPDDWQTLKKSTAVQVRNWPCVF